MPNETMPKWRQNYQRNFFDDQETMHFRPIIANEEFISERRRKYPNSGRQSVPIQSTTEKPLNYLDQEKTTWFLNGQNQNLEKLAYDLLNAGSLPSSSNNGYIENGIKELKLLANPQHFKTNQSNGYNKPTANNNQRNKQQILAGNIF